jgi:hypothetical protein
VFDTYEAAGEARDWIERVLLPHLGAASWLRVVIVGQSVPARGGTTWEPFAAPIITLQLPGPEDWYEYGRMNRPAEQFDLAFVAQVHRLVLGKPALLYGMLGPPS